MSSDAGHARLGGSDLDSHSSPTPGLPPPGLPPRPQLPTSPPFTPTHVLTSISRLASSSLSSAASPSARRRAASFRLKAATRSVTRPSRPSHRRATATPSFWSACPHSQIRSLSSPCSRSPRSPRGQRPLLEVSLAARELDDANALPTRVLVLRTGAFSHGGVVGCAATHGEYAMTPGGGPMHAGLGGGRGMDSSGGGWGGGGGGWGGGGVGGGGGGDLRCRRVAAVALPSLSARIASTAAARRVWRLASRRPLPLASSGRISLRRRRVRRVHLAADVPGGRRQARVQG